MCLIFFKDVMTIHSMHINYQCRPLRQVTLSEDAKDVYSEGHDNMEKKYGKNKDKHSLLFSPFEINSFQQKQKNAKVLQLLCFKHNVFL